MSKQKIGFKILSLFFVATLLLANASQIYAIAPKKCTDSKPSDTPRIRKIYVKPDHAILYFIQVAYDNSYYYVAYGLKEGDERYGVQFPYGGGHGHWVKYAINDLTPNTTYYFKIRGGNGCKPGNWSKWYKTTTPKTGFKSLYF